MRQQHAETILKTLVSTLILAFLLLTSGCATVPEPLRAGPPRSPDPAQVRADPDQYAGMAVRWGGVVVKVENGEEQSKVEMISRPLGEDARPLDTDQTSGRFIAIFNGFVDPVSYEAGRELTVVGVLEGIETRDVGGYHYRFPRVQVTSHYLWPRRPLVVPTPYYYYSPFYDPWYPYGAFYYPYPYYYPYAYPYVNPRPRGGVLPPPRPGQGTPPPRFIQPPAQQPTSPLRPKRERR